MNKVSISWLAALAAVGGIAGFLWWQRQVPVPETPAPVAAAIPAAPASVAAEPAIRHPVAPAGDQAAAAPLPALDQADAVVEAALTDLLGRKAVLSSLQLDRFVRRVVATVDNLPREHAAPRLWPVNPTPGRFMVVPGAEGEIVGADNGLRYTPLVLLAERVDIQRAVAIYVRLYPLFQQAYEELGYKGRYFNDRLVDVIDHLLATPEPDGPLKVRLTEVKGPIPSARPWLRYEFADPSLQALSAGQKMLLRAGPVNERRLKVRLKELRRQLATPR